MTDPTTSRPVAFFTGGARGIGPAIGRWFLAHGHAVALIDIDGAFLCTQAVASVMLRDQRGGAVVNIASISGLRVNAVAPGPVDTEMAKLVRTVAIRGDYHDVTPLSRYSSVEGIANAVGFLCSAQAADINGQVLAVDGGFDANGVGLSTLRSI